MTQHKTTPRRRIHPVHKRIALHASSLLLVFSGGFIPLPLNIFAETHSYDVTARVPAALPASPAFITSPIDGQRFTTNTITVQGTCPDDSYVKVLRGTEVAGVAVCSAGTFTMQISITPGANQLTAKVFNITDDEGPASPSITVYYDEPAQPSQNPSVPPAQPGAPNQPGAPSGIGRPGLRVEVPYKYTVRFPGDTWEWDLVISGGTPPYAVIIDWGDGTNTRYNYAAAGSFAISHAYNKPGQYNMLVKVEDASGLGALLQTPAPVNERVGALFTFPQWLRSLFDDINPWLIWLIYIVLMLLVAIFWWYEIRILHSHIHHRKLRRRHG